jgi:uncharacterized protein YukE
MSQGAPEMGQGERTLSRAASLVADAKADFDSLSRALEGQILGAQGKWAGQGGSAFFALHEAWTQKQSVITSALNEFEASLTSTERDNMSTDETQSATYNRYSSRLG